MQQQQELEAHTLGSSICSSDTCIDEEPVNTRRYAARKAKQCNSWVDKRSVLENAFFESSAPQLPCISCGTTDGDGVLCLDCGPQVVRCIECTVSYHSDSNHLHKPQLILVIEIFFIKINFPFLNYVRLSWKLMISSRLKSVSSRNISPCGQISMDK